MNCSALSDCRAHTDSNSGHVDSLDVHLRQVSEIARIFCVDFGCGAFGTALGLLHDIGKALPEFQEYLVRLEGGESLPSGPPHAIWGAALWYRAVGSAAWREICLPIAGHHGGLASAADLSLKLEKFVRENGEALEALRRVVSSNGLLQEVRLHATGDEDRRLELKVRMLMSALSDADYLATEEHFSPERVSLRLRWPPLEDLWSPLEASQAQLHQRATRDWNHVQEVRAEVYRECTEAAGAPPGVFRLTVPTGGGKTRSGLAFALRHALTNRLRRIVLAVPYTSITEQSATVYREVLGHDAVLEHHSNVNEAEDKEAQAESVMASRLASENWDAPVIVTTTVQLFESLFARRPGRVRKLHNLARSVIILDEVQTLPCELLRPTMDVLRALVLDYGASVVLCTATQPAFDDTPYLAELAGLEIREIVTRCAEHFRALRRVQYEPIMTQVTWTDLASRVRLERQALVIVNTRADALLLLHELQGAAGLVHLSTLLCGAHRRRVLRRIERCLEYGLPVVAVCTQVVEAGVDIDFPIVFRALGPLDRIVQAAGRCNRSGRLPNPGRVVIFEPAEGRTPRGAYRIGQEQARFMLQRDGVDQLHEPAFHHEYFQRLFACVDLDRRRIQDCREHLDFPEVAVRYRFIDDTVPILVRYGRLDEGTVEQWRRSPSREAWRRLQPYVVNLFRHEVLRYEAGGWLDPVGPGLYRWLGEYDRLRGLAAEARDPADFVV